MRKIYDICHWNDLRWHDINIPSFMKTHIGIRAILRFRLCDLRGFNAGISDGRDLWQTQLRWGSSTIIYIQSFIRLVQEFVSCCGRAAYRGYATWEWPTLFPDERPDVSFRLTVISKRGYGQLRTFDPAETITKRLGNQQNQRCMAE